MNWYWLMRSSFSDSNQRIWWQFQLYGKSSNREWWLMIVFDVDIPLLNEDGIDMEWSLMNVKELVCSSMSDWLIIIEIVLLNHLSYSIVIFLLLKTCCLCIHQYCGYQQSMNWNGFLVVLSVLWLKEELERMKRHSIYQIFLP